MASPANGVEMSQSPGRDNLEHGGNYSEHLPYPRNEEEQSFSSTLPRHDGGMFVPPTFARNGKWWFSTFHNVTAMVGAGVLGLPSAMAFLGWGAGITALVLSWIITLYTLWELVEMHEKTPEERFDQYHELGIEAFGEKWGKVFVLLPQLIVLVGIDIVYIVTGGQCLMKFFEIVKCPALYERNQLALKAGMCHQENCHQIGPTAWMIIFAAPQFVFSQIPDLHSLCGLSLAAAVMSICYSTMAWADTIHHHNRQANHGGPHYISKCEPSATLNRKPDQASGDEFLHLSSTFVAFGVMRSLGIIAFAFGGHNVVLEIQATLPSHEKKPSKVPMWKGARLAYVIVGFCYFPVALAGYWAFGNQVYENMLFSLENPRPLIAAVNFMVAIHVLGGYQLYAMPVYGMVERFLQIKFNLNRKSYLMRLLTRCSYVFLTGFVACSLPFFGDLLGLFGGVAFAPTTYFLPCIIWLKVKAPKVLSISWTINWVCIVIGVILSIVSAIGGFFYLIAHASNYEFYQ